MFDKLISFVSFLDLPKRKKYGMRLISNKQTTYLFFFSLIYIAYCQIMFNSYLVELEEKKS